MPGEIAAILAALPAQLPPPANLPIEYGVDWPQQSPLQQFLLVRFFGNSAERASVRAAANSKTSSWRDTVLQAFPPGPLRDRILRKLNTLNRV